MLDTSHWQDVGAMEESLIRVNPEWTDRSAGSRPTPFKRRQVNAAANRVSANFNPFIVFQGQEGQQIFQFCNLNHYCETYRNRSVLHHYHMEV
jgi:hypothetical protein